MLGLWDKYTEENKENYYVDISKFIWYNILGLGCKSILDVGCNIGMELASFPSYARLTGIDKNEKALDIFRQKYPTFQAIEADVLDKIPAKDRAYDFVFDRGLLIHLGDEIEKVMDEMFRVSRKYIMNIEYYGEDGKIIEWRDGESLCYRDMLNRWKSYNVDIISDIEIPYEIDNNRVHYTLVRKHG